MIRINLLKAEGKAPHVEEVKRERKPASPSLIIGLAIVALAAVAFYETRGISKENNLLAAAQEEKNKLKDVLSKLEKVESQKNILMKKINLINDLKSRQETAVRIMDELSRSIPQLVWLNEVTYDKQLIQIKGKALNNKYIAEYISNLKASPYFKNIEIISSIQQTIRDERYLEFSLSLSYTLPSAPNPSPEGKKEEKK